jgi:Large polyvalent protein associated domain 29
MTTAAETARAARAALRKAFPGTKISTTSDRCSVYVRWTDDGPTIETLQEALLAAGCAKTRTDWRGQRHLISSEDSSASYWLDRYNPAFEQLRRRAEAEARLGENTERRPCQIPMTLVEASTWKRRLHLPGKDKEAARQRALQLFPSQHALLARKKDHGRAGAALLVVASLVQS